MKIELIHKTYSIKKDFLSKPPSIFRSNKGQVPVEAQIIDFRFLVLNQVTISIKAVGLKKYKYTKIYRLKGLHFFITSQNANAYMVGLVPLTSSIISRTSMSGQSSMLRYSSPSCLIRGCSSERLKPQPGPPWRTECPIILPTTTNRPLSSRSLEVDGTWWSLSPIKKRVFPGPSKKCQTETEKLCKNGLTT